jgi:hypothetical protein
MIVTEIYNRQVLSGRLACYITTKVVALNEEFFKIYIQ